MSRGQIVSVFLSRARVLRGMVGRERSVFVGFFAKRVGVMAEMRVFSKSDDRDLADASPGLTGGEVRLLAFFASLGCGRLGAAGGIEELAHGLRGF